MLSQVGRQLISGKFNLAGASFPIWCMAPKTILQVFASVSGPKAPYLNAAAVSDDPIFRMK
jgi:hypothetical protein